MNIIRILMAVAAVALSVATSFSKIIDNPYFEKSSELNIKVDRIELTDSTTDVAVTVYSLPRRWFKFDRDIYLKGRSSGENYQLMSAEGVELGKKSYAGDNNYLEVTLRFQPLKNDEKSLDFIEPGGWEILGISLDGKKPEGKIRTHIHGKIADSPGDSWLVLVPGGEDFRVSNNVVIPVRDGRFEYDLFTDDILAFNIIRGLELVKGQWFSNIFFSEGKDIEINFIPDGKHDFAEIIGGGEVTGRYRQLKNENFDYREKNLNQSDIAKKVRAMEENGEFFTKEFIELRKHSERSDLKKSERDSINVLLNRLYDEDRVFSPEGAQAQKEYEELGKKIDLAEITDIYSGSGIAELFELKDRIDMNLNTATCLKTFSENFDDTLKEHPYHKELTELVTNPEPVVGSMFVDVTAPDLDGRDVRISDIIKGKPAAIVLWASWCSPCMRHSKEIIPVYEKYRDKGFEVIGIARESISTEAMENAIARHGYPWLNLVELDDRNRIWAKYRASSTGGKIVLVDSTGRIIAIDPTADEMEKHLATLLGD